jgi:hypothetical protein
MCIATLRDLVDKIENKVCNWIPQKKTQKGDLTIPNELEMPLTH